MFAILTLAKLISFVSGRFCKFNVTDSLICQYTLRVEYATSFDHNILKQVFIDNCYFIIAKSERKKALKQGFEDKDLPSDLIQVSGE